MTHADGYRKKVDEHCRHADELLQIAQFDPQPVSNTAHIERNEQTTYFDMLGQSNFRRLLKDIVKRTQRSKGSETSHTPATNGISSTFQNIT